jgi:hypothetical protein
MRLWKRKLIYAALKLKSKSLDESPSAFEQRSLFEGLLL